MLFQFSNMRHIIYIFIAALTASLVGCRPTAASVDPNAVAVRAAKVYYGYLLAGNYAAYVDGFYRPDSIPASYREQLIVSAKQYVGQMRSDHKGLVAIDTAGARTDTVKKVGEAFLVLTFGDKTKEEIVVPMVLHGGNWMLR